MLVGCTLEGVKVQPDAKPQAMRPVVVVIMEAAGAFVFWVVVLWGACRLAEAAANRPIATNGR